MFTIYQHLQPALVRVALDLKIFNLLVEANDAINVEELSIKTDSSPLLLGRLSESSDSACGSQICHKNAQSFDPQLQIYQIPMYTIILLGRILRYLASVGTIKETTKDVCCQQHYYTS